MAVQVFSFSRKRSEWTSSRYRRYRSKGIGDACPNKQICEDCTGGKIEKMSEPVQVYTACQFVRTQKRFLLLLFPAQFAISFNEYKNNFEFENKNVVITHFCVEFVAENDII